MPDGLGVLFQCVVPEARAVICEFGKFCQGELAPNFDKGWHLTGLSGLLAPL